MEPPILASRRELLRRTQNADGGWGYFAGKQSWFEPTFYAVLALPGEPAAERGWSLLKAWQTTDGGWKPAAHIPDSTWVTALGVTLCCVREEYGQEFNNGVRWLLGMAGSESQFF